MQLFKENDEPPTVKEISRARNLSIQERRLLRKQEKSILLKPVDVDITANLMNELNITCESTQNALPKIPAIAESLDDWQYEQTTDRAKLEDLSLEKKKLRLKTV